MGQYSNQLTKGGQEHSYKLLLVFNLIVFTYNHESFKETY